MPVPIDRSQPPEFGVPPGTYLLEVKECEQKVSKKRESMLHVTFKVVGGACSGEEIEDYFMLQGRGRGMGHNKLAALGIDWTKDFEAYDLVARRAYAAIVQETREWQGKQITSSRIDVYAEGSRSGLWDENDPPASVGSPDLFDGDETSSTSSTDETVQPF